MSVTASNTHLGGPIVKQVNATITGTTALTVWTPSNSTRRIRLHGVSLTAQITTVLAGATPFDAISVCDNTSAAPLWDIGKIVTATDAVGLNYGFQPLSLPYGHPLAAVTNVLVVTTVSTIGSGVIRIRGFVWGDEVAG